MITPKIVERIKRLPFAGVISDENRLDSIYILNLVDAARGQVLRTVYQKDKRINNIAYQKFYGTYDINLQEGDGIVRFACPTFIGMDAWTDGCRYVGSNDCSNAYARIKNRSELSTIQNHKIMKSLANVNISALYDASMGQIQIYFNPEVEELLVEGLFSKPTSIPTFNYDFDEYPINEDLIPMLEDQILKNVTAKEASTLPMPRNQSMQVAGAPMAPTISVNSTGR